MSLSSDLLEQAEHLLKRERQRPRQASLRRSVSSSYYALFHLLTVETTTLIGPNMTLDPIQRIQRWFDHGEMKRVCGMFSVPTAPRQLSAILGTPVSNDMQLIALSFIQLQEARHDADYNLATTWTRLTAQQYAQLARNAFAAWLRVRKSHEANVFALALLSVKLFDKER